MHQVGNIALAAVSTKKKQKIPTLLEQISQKDHSGTSSDKIELIETVASYVTLNANDGFLVTVPLPFLTLGARGSMSSTRFLVAFFGSLYR